MTSSNMPPVGPPEPEFLEQSGGSLLRPGRPSTWRVRPVVWTMAGVLVVGLGAVGAWAAVSFFRTGAQPAEALPASTLAYASVDLDPSGEQKIAAVRLLRKFPAIRDEIGLDTTDDLRRIIFEEIRPTSGTCSEVDYADDIEPWLGDRMAVAAVDTGAQEPSPVLVLQVSDPEAAASVLATLRDCPAEEARSFQPSGASATDGGWVADGEWMVLAETEEIAQGVVDATREGSLADDTDYQDSIASVGDSGIINVYASSEIGPFLGRELGSTGMGAAPYAEALEGFGGFAGAVRFEGSSLELEMVSDGAELPDSLGAGDRGADVVSGLPIDTVLALGVGFEEGWASTAWEKLSATGGPALDSIVAQVAQQAGLELPADLETLTGESMALSVGSGFDMEELMNSASLQAPIAWTVDGDTAAVDDVLTRVRGRIGAVGSQILGSDSSDGLTVIGPDADYRAEVLAGGELGELESFRDVVPEADRAAGLIFVNFDTGDGWLARLAAGDTTVIENVEPLHAFGASAWRDGTTLHALVRLTTD